MVAMQLFDAINSGLDLHILPFYGKNEIRFYDNQNSKLYLYDSTIPSLKYCIEFNGDLWHANPSIYKADDFPNPFYPELVAQEIWDN